jgi:hypothetical protein
MLVFFVFFAVGFTPIAPPHAGLYSEPLFLKTYDIRLNLPGLCNIGKIFHSLPCPAFILGFSALFKLGLVCPHLCTFRTCGNTTCGAFVFPPDKVMHCMILGWKTDMMGLMLAFQFTLPLGVKVSITQGKKFPHFPYNLAQHLSSINQNQL